MIVKLSYIPWIIGIVIASYFLYRALKRIIKGIINYRKLGREEFVKRLKDGFDAITPTQRTRGELNGIVVSLIGLLIGAIVVPIYRVEGFWYWVEISLIGGVILTVWQLIAKVQQYRILKKQDKIMEDLQKQNKLEKEE